MHTVEARCVVYTVTVLGYITCMAFRYSTLSRLARVGFLYSFSSREEATTETLEVVVFSSQCKKYIVKY